MDCGDAGTQQGTTTVTLTGGSFVCRFPDGDDTSDVSVQVRDSDGALSNIASQTVEIANVAPHISLTGPDTADEGESKTYAILVTDPGDDTHTITRSCGAHGVEVSFTYDQLTHIGSLVCNFPDGPTTTEVTATVKDSDDATDTDEQLVTVTVSNVPPVITPPAAQTADEGVSKLFDLGSFTDAGADSPWAVSVDWGDASSDTDFSETSAGSITDQSHTYADDGTYTVTITVTEDGALASDTETFTITVANVAPVVTAAADQTADEGVGKLFDLGSFTDSGADSPWAVSVDWGDASTDTLFSEASAGSITDHSHTYADDGTYTVTVSVTEDGAAAFGRRHVHHHRRQRHPGGHRGGRPDRRRGGREELLHRQLHRHRR